MSFFYLESHHKITKTIWGTGFDNGNNLIDYISRKWEKHLYWTDTFFILSLEAYISSVALPIMSKSIAYFEKIAVYMENSGFLCTWLTQRFKRPKCGLYHVLSSTKSRIPPRKRNKQILEFKNYVMNTLEIESKTKANSEIQIKTAIPELLFYYPV